MKHALQEGSLLDHDKYVIKGVLGQGGFGITYLALDIALEKYVSIKEFFPKDYCHRDQSTSHMTISSLSMADMIERLKVKFLKEARNIAKFDNPNIIRIHTAFEENGTAYYVMDYVEGESLAEMVKRIGPIDMATAVDYISKIGRALEYVHAHHINHLDIKPANIMVRRFDNNPILIDFGLAKRYDEHGGETSTTPTGISYGYAPFEQYQSEGIRDFSPQTDVYSLAATLYYILTGVTPPQATELIEGYLTFPGNFPEQLKGVVIKAMSTRRLDRYPTAMDFVSALMEAAYSNNSPYIPPMHQQPQVQPQSPAFPNPEVEQPQPIPADYGQRENTIAITNYDDDDELYDLTAEESSKKSGKSSNAIIIALIGSVIIVAGVVTAFFVSRNGKSVENVVENVTINESGIVSNVTDMPYSVAGFGECLYTGEVNGADEPDGKGEAKWAKGKAISYDGEWKNGKMEGEAFYTLRNGDTFKGSFVNNEYEKGRYTIKSSGEYFEGSYRNRNPYKGAWYSADGKLLETVNP